MNLFATSAWIYTRFLLVMLNVPERPTAPSRLSYSLLFVFVREGGSDDCGSIGVFPILLLFDC